MPKKHNYWYIAVTNDEYELTLFCGDTFAELARWVRAMGDHCSKGTLIASPTGVAITRNKEFRILRIHSRTGKTLVGKVPDRTREK